MTTNDITVTTDEVVLRLSLTDAEALIDVLNLTPSIPTITDERKAQAVVLYLYAKLAYEQTIAREVSTLDDILPNLKYPWANGSREGASLVRQFDPTDQDPT